VTSVTPSSAILGLPVVPRTARRPARPHGKRSRPLVEAHKEVDVNGRRYPFLQLSFAGALLDVDELPPGEQNQVEQRAKALEGYED
jgi:hypothetical protein